MQQSPLVGREAELSAVAAALRRRPAEAVLLSGDPGVGKTRLAQEACRSLGDRAEPLLAVGSEAARTIPLGAFAGVLTGDLEGAGGSLDLLRAARQRLAERGRTAQAVLVVDDAHLLDDASAALLQQVVADRELPVVATVRSGAPAPDAVSALTRYAWVHRLDVSVLAEADVGQLAAATLGGPVDVRAAHVLAELSRGNALYLHELIRSSTAAGLLTEAGGVWRLSGPPPAPAALVELLAARFDRLDTRAQSAVNLLAVGGSLGLSWLEAETGEQALEQLEEAGLVELHVDGRRHEVRLAHPLFGEVARARLPALRARRVRRVLADSLADGRLRRRGDALRLALWQLDAGLPGEAAVLARAAEEATVGLDWTVTERVAAAAWEAGAGVPAGIRLAESMFKQGRRDEALELFETLLPLAVDDEQRVRVINGQAYLLSNQLGRYADAVAAVERALPTISEPKTRALLVQRLAFEHVFAGRPALASRTLEPLLDESSPDFARSSYPAALALWMQGRFAEAIAVSEAGERSHRVSGASHMPAEVQLVPRVLALAATGRAAEAVGHARELVRVTAATNDEELQATGSLVLMWALLAQGSLGEGLAVARQGAATNRKLHDPAALRWCLGGIALAAGQLGQPDVAADAVAELDAAERGEWVLLELDLVERGRAWAAVAGSDLAGGRSVLAAAAGRAREAGLHAAEILLLTDLARIGDAGAAAPRLGELSRALGSPLVTAEADFASAAAAGKGAGLQRCADRLGALGACLLAREAATLAAAAYARARDSRRAGACRRLADTWAATTAGAATPALADTPAMTALTGREREIALLAAKGLRSGDIAAQLVLSPRTVENHLNRAYQKLGISTRAELPTALGGAAEAGRS
ncbi:AAA family ATPase [Motilibacter deserti]|uniref:AAA family ATPase n=1 Tax=Motilibacter deserti TaxID=2714956 RepID=A0ABX0GVZ7_9ACTN|nr:AAA family ATPase [Motilibacter deserti]